MAKPSSIEMGKALPETSGESQLGAIRIRDYMEGAWGLILTFPRGEDPVWSTELGMLAKLKSEFDARDCRLLAINVTSLESQKDFIADVNETQDVALNFPIMADPHSKTLSKLCGPPPHLSSSMILLDTEHNVQMVWSYPTCVGKNLYEVLRALDALQVCLYNQVVTPTNWQINDDVFIEPGVTTEAAKQLFPQGFHEIKSYFRITPSPAVVADD